MLPTPGIAYLTRSLEAQGGVVLSASHNPFQDNGIKIFSSEGAKFPDAWEDEIETRLAGPDGAARPPDGRETATAVVSALAALHCAWGVRVHDVRASVDAVKVVEAWTRGGVKGSDG